MLSINWKQTESKCWVGSDQHGNKYNYGALRETCSVDLLDGRGGYGWTPEDAYRDATTRPHPANKSLVANC